MRRKGLGSAVIAVALAAGAPAWAQGGAQGKAGKLDKSLVEAAQKLHASNQGEVKAGQLGAERAQSPEVKAFAERMVTDHQENDRQLTSMAPSLGASLQGDAFSKKQREAEKELRDVQGKSGAEFDRAYMKMMVKEHERDVKEVGDAAKDARKAQQAELASFLDQTHSHLQMHLDEAKRVERSLAKGVASGGTGASDSSTAPSSAAGSSGTQSDSSRDRSSTSRPPGTSRGDTGAPPPPTGGSGTGTTGSGSSGSSDSQSR